MLIPTKSEKRDIYMISSNEHIDNYFIVFNFIMFLFENSKTIF